MVGAVVAERFARLWTEPSTPVNLTVRELIVWCVLICEIDYEECQAFHLDVS